MAGGKVTLSTLLGNHAASQALKTGAIASDLVTLDFADVKVPNTAFKAVVREARYDLAELAIVTFLQARIADKPYALLPITIMGRGQLHTLFHNTQRPVTPQHLAGKRIGVRSYTTTTGVWVRGLLHDLYGVDPNGVTWLTFEDPHVAEYRDPPNVQRAPEGQTLEAMLLSGAIDAAILGNVEQKPPLAPLLPDAAAIDRQWALSHGGVPINHMLVIRSDIARARPDVVRDLYRLFSAAKQAAFPAPPSPDPVRLGVDANRQSLEIIIDYALRQKLIPRRLTVDELFADTQAAIAG